MFNLIFNGRLGNDAETKRLNENDYYAFRVAVDGRRREDPTTWVRVLLRKGASSRLGDFLKSGQAVLIEGRPQISAYTNREGTAVPSIDVFADHLDLIGGRPEAAAPAPAAPTPAKAAPAPADDDTDLPF